MRITQKTIFSNFMRDINKNRSQMAELGSDLSSGRSVRVPSQGPVAFERSRIIEENVRKEGQYQNNVTSGLRQARQVQETLDETIDRLIDIKRLTVQGSTDSMDASTRDNLGEEVTGIKEGLVDAMNLSYGDRYLLAGTNSDNAPFEMDAGEPGEVGYLGNDNAPKVLVADGVEIEISITGEELRDTPAGDLFGVILDVEDALKGNDPDAVNDLLPVLDDTIDYVADLASGLGNNINRMEFTFESYESKNIIQESNISELVDTDFAQAFSDQQRTQVAFEAAMAVHASMFGNTLLDYL